MFRCFPERSAGACTRRISLAENMFGRLRLTFLWRFTLVTLGVSIVSAYLLAATMEWTHRKAIETDIEIAAISRLSAELATPLDQLSVSGLTQSLIGTFERVIADAKLFEYVSGARVYLPNGEAIYPRDAPPSPQDVRHALAEDNFRRVEKRRAP